MKNIENFRCYQEFQQFCCVEPKLSECTMQPTYFPLGGSCDCNLFLIGT